MEMQKIARKYCYFFAIRVKYKRRIRMCEKITQKMGKKPRPQITKSHRRRYRWKLELEIKTLKALALYTHTHTHTHTHGYFTK